jgi:hypothetical protein
MNQFGSMGSGAEGGDGMLDAIQRWDDRLSAAAQVRPGSTATMANQIGVLADEVLRQHHGLTRSADPVRARALVGENLWTVWDDLGRRPRTPAELAAVVGRLETLRMEGQHGERT